MTKELMIDNIIKALGFEHPVTIKFCELCESSLDNEIIKDVYNKVKTIYKI